MTIGRVRELFSDAREVFDLPDARLAAAVTLCGCSRADVLVRTFAEKPVSRTGGGAQGGHTGRGGLVRVGLGRGGAPASGVEPRRFGPTRRVTIGRRSTLGASRAEARAAAARTVLRAWGALRAARSGPRARGRMLGAARSGPRARGRMLRAACLGPRARGRAFGAVGSAPRAWGEARSGASEAASSAPHPRDASTVSAGRSVRPWVGALPGRLARSAWLSR